MPGEQSSISSKLIMHISAQNSAVDHCAVNIILKCKLRFAASYNNGSNHCNIARLFPRFLIFMLIQNSIVALHPVRTISSTKVFLSIPPSLTNPPKLFICNFLTIHSIVYIIMYKMCFCFCTYPVSLTRLIIYSPLFFFSFLLF